MGCVVGGGDLSASVSTCAGHQAAPHAGTCAMAGECHIEKPQYESLI